MMLKLKNAAYFVLLCHRYYKEHELIMVSSYLLQSTWLRKNSFCWKVTLEISTFLQQRRSTENIARNSIVCLPSILKKWEKQRIFLPSSARVARSRTYAKLTNNTTQLSGSVGLVPTPQGCLGYMAIKLAKPLTTPSSELFRNKRAESTQI